MGSTVIQYNAKYGTAANFQFSTENSAGTDLLTSAATVFDAGDWKISKDGGALANTTNLPTQITASQPGYQIALTAVELQASEILVTGRDVATGSYQPAILKITTRINLGQMTIDATQITGDNNGLNCAGSGTGSGVAFTGGPTNGDGMHCIGNGNGDGIQTEGGAGGVGIGNGIDARSLGTGSGFYLTGGTNSGAGMTCLGGAPDGDGIHTQGVGDGDGLQAEALSTGDGIVGVANGNGNGMRLEAVGAGNGMEAVGGSSGAGIIARSFSGQAAFYGDPQIAGSKPSNFLSAELLEDINSLPSPGSTNLSQGIAAIVARLYYLVTQTTTQQKQYKSDSATLIGTAPVSDDGITQVKGKSV